MIKYNQFTEEVLYFLDIRMGELKCYLNEDNNDIILTIPLSQISFPADVRNVTSVKLFFDKYPYHIALLTLYIQYSYFNGYDGGYLTFFHKSLFERLPHNSISKTCYIFENHYIFKILLSDFTYDITKLFYQIGRWGYYGIVINDYVYFIRIL